MDFAILSKFLSHYRLNGFALFFKNFVSPLFALRATRMYSLVKENVLVSEAVAVPNERKFEGYHLNSNVILKHLANSSVCLSVSKKI